MIIMFCCIFLNQDECVVYGVNANKLCDYERSLTTVALQLCLNMQCTTYTKFHLLQQFLIGFGGV